MRFHIYFQRKNKHLLLFFCIFAILTISFSSIIISKTANKDIKNESLEEPVFNTYSFSDHIKYKEGYGIFIDGKYIAVCENKDEIDNSFKKALDVMAAYYSVDTKSVNAKFLNKISVVPGSFEKEIFIGTDKLLEKLGIVGDDLMLNDNTQTINLDIGYTVDKVVETIIPYNTEYVNLSTKDISYSNVVQEGVEGKIQSDYIESYVDGVLVSSQKIDDLIITDKADEIIERGIVIDSTKTSAKLGLFKMPYNGRISCGFGWRDFFNGITNFHNGIDIVHTDNGQSCYGAPIMAAADGVVVFAGDNGGYGNYILIKHDNGVQTGYGHLSKITVTVGQEVKCGDVIGNIGSTGISTGPHLHFEVLINGMTKDPTLYLKDAE